jgi:hypothetical protein
MTIQVNVTPERFAAVFLGVAAAKRIRKEGEHWVGVVSRGCLQPRVVELRARLASPRWNGLTVPEKLEGALMTGTLVVPCGRCAVCLARRQREWAHRMKAELELAKKTWLVTLTYRPSARGMLKERYGVLSAEEWEKALYSDVQKWVKRLRHHASDGVRYCVISEEHRDGWLHWHLLLHGDLKRKEIRLGHWPHGFVDARLVKGDAPAYVSKYLVKTGRRVRASLGYGHGAPFGAVVAQSGDADSPVASSAAREARPENQTTPNNRPRNDARPEERPLVRIAAGCRAGLEELLRWLPSEEDVFDDGEVDDGSLFVAAWFGLSRWDVARAARERAWEAKAARRAALDGAWSDDPATLVAIADARVWAGLASEEERDHARYWTGGVAAHYLAAAAGPWDGRGGRS